MNVRVRNAVFETNSSSTHSVTVSHDEIYEPSLSRETLRKGVIEVRPHEFGWGWKRFYTAEEKIGYLLAQVCADDICSRPAGSDCSALLKERHPRAKSLLEAVEKATGCAVKVIVPAKSWGMEVYVDHQSSGVGMELFRSKKELLRFVLSKDSYVETGNDNSNCGEFIETDRGTSEEFYPGHYVSDCLYEDEFLLRTDGFCGKVAFKTDEFEAEASSDFRGGIEIKRALESAVCTGATVILNGSAGARSPEQAGRDMIHSFVSDVSDYSDGGMKLHRDAKVTAFVSEPGHEPYIGDCRFELRCRAPKETVEALRQAVLNLASKSNGITP